MTKYQRRCCEMFVRVRGFGDRYRERFPESSPGGLAFAAVRHAETEIDALLVKWVLAVDDRRWRARARAAIVRSLLSVALAARRIARDDRSMHRRFVMPSPQTDRALLETARRFARDAAASEARFLNAGLPPTFLADLRERIDEFDRAVRLRRSAQTAASAARRGMAVAFKRGFDAILTLDVVIASSHADDPVMLAGWKSSRRVDRKRVRRAKPAALVA